MTAPVQNHDDDMLKEMDLCFNNHFKRIEAKGNEIKKDNLPGELSSSKEVKNSNTYKEVEQKVLQVVCGAENGGPMCRISPSYVQKKAVLCAEPCAEPCAGSEAKDLKIQQLQKLSSMSVGDFTSDRFYHADPHTTIANLCSYLLYQEETPGTPKTRTLAAAILKMDFDLLYEKDAWVDIALQTFEAMKRGFKKKGNVTVQLFVLENEILKRIPADRMIVKECKQKLTVKEIAYILQQIIKLSIDNARQGRERAFIKAEMFVPRKGGRGNKERQVETYKNKTGRALNSHKLATITGLLNEFGLVKKYHPKNDAGHITGTFYEITQNNPYRGVLDRVLAQFKKGVLDQHAKETFKEKQNA